MSENTDGTWEAVPRHDDFEHYAIVARFGNQPRAKLVVADTLNCDSTFSIADQEANARLIAAAPDLLAACKAAFHDIRYADAPEASDLLRAAIAKAEGR